MFHGVLAARVATLAATAFHGKAAVAVDDHRMKLHELGCCSGTSARVAMPVSSCHHVLHSKPRPSLGSLTSPISG
jgi:hypothetical protein